MSAKIKKITLGRTLEKSFRGFLVASMIVYCISLLVVFAWVLFSSLKSYIDFSLHAFSLPEKFEFENYATVFKVFKITLTSKSGSRMSYGMDAMLIYSLVYSLCRTFVSVVLYVLMAYAMSKYNFFGKNFLYALGIFVMITPIVGSMPSMMRIKKALGLYNQMTASILTCNPTAFSGLHFLLLYGAFKSMPWAYAEAAFMDGAGHWTVFLKIMLPMILPTCVVLYVLEFMGMWNDYQTFLVWLPSYPSLSLGLILFQYEAVKNRISMPVILAAFVVVMIPMIILYAASQKLIMEKMNIGGLKG